MLNTYQVTIVTPYPFSPFNLPIAYNLPYLITYLSSPPTSIYNVFNYLDCIFAPLTPPLFLRSPKYFYPDSHIETTFPLLRHSFPFLYALLYLNLLISFHLVLAGLSFSSISPSDAKHSFLS